MRCISIPLALLAGCTFFGGGTGGDDICPATATPDLATAPLRDPGTGQCESFGGGCRGIPYPDWAVCQGSCEGLDEHTCRTTDLCRAIYAGTQRQYVGCWGTAPQSHVTGGDCAAITDPYQCSEHDDCAALFAAAIPPPMQWVGCIAEPLDPGTCDGQVLCRIATPACPPETVAGIAHGCYTGFCIPKAQCSGALDPGTCEPAVCDAIGPACPTGTTAGVANGCYTGYCIPDGACPR